MAINKWKFEYGIVTNYSMNDAPEMFLNESFDGLVMYEI